MKREKIADKILCYMKDEIEKSGNQINHIHFNFSFSEKVDYFNAPSEILPDGEDLTNIKKMFKKKISNENFREALNFARTNNYVILHYGSRNFDRIEITEEGFARATSIKNYHPIKNYFKKLFLDNIIPTLINIGISAIVACITAYLTIKGRK